MISPLLDLRLKRPPENFPKCLEYLSCPSDVNVTGGLELFSYNVIYPGLFNE